ncbi:hypothetical protein ACLVWQ_32210 (plasmid) [Streptomyces sp. CWNU-52B]|uniref:hypothetical protein n=1 Tax=unclassified Streptomyces TaxID=2593676 RepID=UPI0039C06F93
MTDALTLNELAGPLQALRLLALDFGHLPALNVDVTPLYPKVLRLSLHETTCDSFAAFEQWRHALSIETGDVDFHVQINGRTAVLDGHGTYGGMAIELTAFAAVPSADTASVVQGVPA